MNIRSMMKKFKEPAAMNLFTFLYPVLFFLELTALASSIGMYCLKIRMVDPVNWLIALLDVKVALKYLVIVPILTGMITYVLFRSRNAKIFYNIVPQGIGLLLLFILLFIPLNIFNVIAFVIITTFSLFRIVNASGIRIPEFPDSHRTMAIMAVIGGLLGAAYGIYVQYYDLYHLTLIFSDWSVYVISYQELAADGFSVPWKFFNTGGHFNLLPNLLGTLLFTITSDPFAIFILNSLVIYSAVPCTYFAARSNGVAPFHSLLFALGLLFHFTLANLNSCVFYGYHPNIYMIPLFLLFWGYFSQKKYLTAAVFVVLSLLVQETFAVFWFGFGLFLTLFYSGKWRLAGAGIMLLMVGWFFFATRVVMSWGDAANAAQYHQMFHYSNLGNSIPEIVLSPFVRTEIFFRELFSIENFYFALMLFISFPAVVFYPKLAVVTILPLLGIFLLNGNLLCNVAMQYQVEVFVVLIAASVSGLACCAKRSVSRTNAVLCGALMAFFVCGSFIGRVPWGFFKGVIKAKAKEDCREKIEKIKSIIPAGSKIQTSYAYQAHFIGRNILYDFSEGKIRSDADYIILPWRDLFMGKEQIDELIGQIRDSEQWNLTSIDSDVYKAFVLERIKPQNKSLRE